MGRTPWPAFGSVRQLDQRGQGCTEFPFDLAFVADEFASEDAIGFNLNSPLGGPEFLRGPIRQNEIQIVVPLERAFVSVKVCGDVVLDVSPEIEVVGQHAFTEVEIVDTDGPFAQSALRAQDIVMRVSDR